MSIKEIISFILLFVVLGVLLSFVFVAIKEQIKENKKQTELKQSYSHDLQRIVTILEEINNKMK